MSQPEAPPSDVLDAISRCAAVMDDDGALQDELHALRLASDPVAQLAVSLIDLERARHGVSEVRERLGELAESLLVYWNDGSGGELALAHPYLEGLWSQAAALLSSFEGAKLTRALLACWEARSDAGHLTLAIEELLPEGDRRVEFARCLYHLELARMMVESSRAEFSRRAGLLAEAYRDPEVAAELIGSDAGLAHLFKEVVPYLDEFFEHLEAEAERRTKGSGVRAASDSPPPDPLESTAAFGTPDVHHRQTDPDFQLEEALERGGGRVGPPPSAPRAEAVELAAGATPTPAKGSAYRDPLDFIGEDAPRPVPGFRTLVGSRSPLKPVPPPPSPDHLAHLEAEAKAVPKPEAEPQVEAELEQPPEPSPEPEPEPELAESEAEAEVAPPVEPPTIEGVVEEPILEAEVLGVEELPEGEVLQSGPHELDDMEVVSIPTPPPLPATPAHGRPGAAASPRVRESGTSKATQEFWLHTFATLELLPGELGRSARILACETRANRKRLNEFIDSLAPHLAVPEARAFACLIGLMLAGQTKEKSLFGQPNPRRAEALAAALPYLATSPEAAAHVAVWFELDGAETQAALARGLQLLAGYLAYCVRTQQDPLALPTVDAFTT